MTFDKLEFKEHSMIPKGVQSRHDFGNGYILSVVGGDSLYGDGKNTFEVGVFDERGGFTRKFWNDDVDDDVRGWLSKSEVTELMERISKVEKII
tara:strand:- start:204 stop:485 length:282 start_codon:yes stop_codon:yes gene_type:complete